MGSVLIVDDHVEGCRALMRLIRHYGHETECLHDGQSTLKRLAEPCPLPHLLILDWMMPGMDGCEVLTRLRGEGWTRSLPIVMFTAVNDEALRELAFRLGATDFWVKGTSQTLEQIRKGIERFTPHSLTQN